MDVQELGKLHTGTTVCPILPAKGHGAGSRKDQKLVLLVQGGGPTSFVAQNAFFFLYQLFVLER